MSAMKYLYQKIGQTGYGKTKSIEIANELLSKNCKELDSYIKIQPREGGYFVHEHKEKITSKCNEASDKQAEKKKIREAVINNYRNYTLDYEVNIVPGGKQNIDVLFFHDGYLFIGEGKGPKSSGNEPLLKAVLEVETYSRIIYPEKILEDYKKNVEWLSEKIKYNTIKKAVILFEQNDGSESPMRKQLYQKKYLPIHKLMKKLQIYAIKAELFCQEKGRIEFYKNFSPSDY